MAAGDPIRLVIQFDKTTNRGVIREIETDLDGLARRLARLNTVGVAGIGGGNAFRALQNDINRTAVALRNNLTSAAYGVESALGSLFSMAYRVGRFGFYFLAGAAAAVVASFTLLTKTFFNINEQFSNLEITMQSAFRSVVIAKQLRQELVKITAWSPLPFKSLADVTRSFSVIPFSRGKMAQEAVGGFGKQDEFFRTSIRLVEQMTAFRPDKTTEDAIFALREALSGQFRSLVRRFDIPLSVIARAGQTTAKELAVNTEKAYESIRKFFGSIITPEAIQQYIKQPSKLFENIVEQVFIIPLTKIGDAGFFKKVIDFFYNFYVKLVDFVSGKLDPFAKKLSDSMSRIFDQVIDVGGEVFEKLMTSFGGGKLALPGMDPFERILILIERAVSYLDKNLPELLEKLVKGFEALWGALQTVGKYAYKAFAWVTEGFSTQPFFTALKLLFLTQLPKLIGASIRMITDRLSVPVSSAYVTGKAASTSVIPTGAFPYVAGNIAPGLLTSGTQRYRTRNALGQLTAVQTAAVPSRMGQMFAGLGVGMGAIGATAASALPPILITAAVFAAFGLAVSMFRKAVADFEVANKAVVDKILALVAPTRGQEVQNLRVQQNETTLRGMMNQSMDPAFMGASQRALDNIGNLQKRRNALYSFMGSEEAAVLPMPADVASKIGNPSFYYKGLAGLGVVPGYQKSKGTIDAKSASSLQLAIQYYDKQISQAQQTVENLVGAFGGPISGKLLPDQQAIVDESAETLTAFSRDIRATIDTFFQKSLGRVNVLTSHLTQTAGYSFIADIQKFEDELELELNPFKEYTASFVEMAKSFRGAEKTRDSIEALIGLNGSINKELDYVEERGELAKKLSDQIAQLKTPAFKDIRKKVTRGDTTVTLNQAGMVAEMEKLLSDIQSDKPAKDLYKGALDLLVTDYEEQSKLILLNLSKMSREAMKQSAGMIAGSNEAENWAKSITKSIYSGLFELNMEDLTPDIVELLKATVPRFVTPEDSQVEQLRVAGATREVSEFLKAAVAIPLIGGFKDATNVADIFDLMLEAAIDAEQKLWDSYEDLLRLAQNQRTSKVYQTLPELISERNVGGLGAKFRIEQAAQNKTIQFSTGEKYTPFEGVDMSRFGGRLEGMENLPQLMKLRKEMTDTILPREIERRKALKLVQQAEIDANNQVVEQLSDLADAYAEASREIEGGGLFTSLEEGFMGVAYEMKAMAGNLENVGREVAKTLTDSFSNSLYDFITATKSAKEAFQGFAQSVVEGLAKIAAQKFSEQLFGYLFSAAGDAAGGIRGALVAKASGGVVRGGSGARDDVPAVLTGGEYVMRKSSVQRYGERFMDAVNTGKVPLYSEGGAVSGQPSKMQTYYKNSAATNVVNVSVDNRGNATSSGQFTGNQTAMAQEIEQAVLGVVAKHSREGGAFWRGRGR
jgi:hypothetical protein